VLHCAERQKVSVQTKDVFPERVRVVLVVLRR
jgi:hypothetical protein